MKYIKEWVVPADRKAIEAKFEEVMWMNTLVYAVGGVISAILDV